MRAWPAPAQGLVAVSVLPGGAVNQVGISGGNTSGSSGGNPGSVFLAGGNNITLSQVTGAGGATVTISAGGATISSYENIPLINTTALTFDGTMSSHAVAFVLPQPMSASFMRIPMLMTTNSTSLATTAQAATSFQMGLFSTLNAVVYSLGTGANSKSLQSVASGSAGFTQSNKVSISNTTNFSFSDAFTYQVEGGATSSSSQWSVTQTRIDLVTTNWQSNYTSLRMVDINFANSLPAGPYWLLVGLSTSSSTNNASYAAGTNANVRYSNHFGVSLLNSHFGIFGSTNLTSGGFEGAGLFSTVGGGTTASMNISAISSVASAPKLYFQMLRSA